MSKTKTADHAFVVVDKQGKSLRYIMLRELRPTRRKPVESWMSGEKETGERFSTLYRIGRKNDPPEYLWFRRHKLERYTFRDYFVRISGADARRWLKKHQPDVYPSDLYKNPPTTSPVVYKSPLDGPFGPPLKPGTGALNFEAPAGPQSNDVTRGGKEFTTARIRAMTGLTGKNTIAKYVKLARITGGKPGHSPRFTESEARRILQAVRDKCIQTDIIAKAEESLEKHF